MGAATAAVVSFARRASPLPLLLRGVARPVLLLVAGLFVLVEGLDRTGLIGVMAQNLARAAQADPQRAAWTAGAALAFVSNLVNNLPAGLTASAAR